MGISFDPKVQTARKTHKCWACLCEIPKGMMYVSYPGKNSAGDFQSTKLCHECSVLLTKKTGATALTIRQGEFSERLIPNCLRKVRNEFRKEPMKMLKEIAEKANSTPATPPKPCNLIVVKASELERRIFHLPESRWKVEQFPKGASLIVKAGVNGESRTATIKGAWSTDGSGFGCNKRQVAVLVA
jgi:hypothetical protein